MQIEEIDAKDVKAAVDNGALFIDVREPYEVSEVAYDIPNRREIPLGDIPNQMDEISKDQPLVIGCRSGARSMNACQYLKSQGYSEVKNLRGGITGWIDNGLPTV